MLEQILFYPPIIHHLTILSTRKKKKENYQDGTAGGERDLGVGAPQQDMLPPPCNPFCPL